MAQSCGRGLVAVANPPRQAQITTILQLPRGHAQDLRGVFRSLSSFYHPINHAAAGLIAGERFRLLAAGFHLSDPNQRRAYGQPFAGW